MSTAAMMSVAQAHAAASPTQPQRDGGTSRLTVNDLFPALPRSAPPDRLGVWALQVAHLPPAARTERFDALLHLTGQWPGAERGMPLTRLAESLEYLPQTCRRARFAALLDQARELPDAHHRELELLLAQRIPALDDADRADACLAVLRTTARWPAASRLRVIGQLCMQLRQLPASQRLAVFRALVERSRALGHAGAMEANYLALHVADLPLTARHEALVDVVNRLKLLPEDDHTRATALLPLARRIHDLPAESRADALRQIADALRPLPGPLRDLVLTRPDQELSAAIREALHQAIAAPTTAAFTAF